MASSVAIGSRTGCISAKSDKCLKARTVSGEARNPGDPHDCHSQHKTTARLEMVWCGTCHHRDISCSRAGLLHRDPRDGGRGPLSRQTVVTGEGEANRMIGFASCMEDVLGLLSAKR